MGLKKTIFLFLATMVFIGFGATAQTTAQQIVDNNKAGQVSKTEKKSCCSKTSLKKATVSVNAASKNESVQNQEDCPLLGTPDCPLIKKCPKKGQPDCPLIQNCPKKGTPDCPFKKGIASCCVEN